MKELFDILREFGIPGVCLGMMFVIHMLTVKRLVPIVTKLEISISRLIMVLIKREQEIDECSNEPKN